MVDTLVLGTSAKAWEFESLHAHHKNRADEVRFFQCTLAVFALSYGGGQVHFYTLERDWYCRLLLKLKIRYRLKSRLITVSVAPSSRNENVGTLR